MNRERLRPLGLGDVFDEGFDLYKRNFTFLLLVGAAVLVPLDMLAAWVSPRLLPPIFAQFDVTTSKDDQFSVWAVTSLVRLTLFLPFYALALCPLVLAASARYLDKAATLASVYGRTLKRLPSLIATVVLVGLTLDLSLLGCGVAWLLAACQLFFTLPAALIEGLGPGKAMKRSGALAGGYGGRVFSCLLVLGLISWVLSLGLWMPLAYVFGSVLNLTPGADTLYGGGVPGAGGSAEQEVISLLSRGLTHLFLTPFLVCVMTVLYYDLRIRKEGFDVEMLAQDLGYPALAALGPHLPPVAAYGVMRPGARPPIPPPGYAGPPPPGYGGPRR